MKLLYCLLLSLCPCISHAQARALNPGDPVPDILFNQVLNYKSSTARLSGFKDKLVILDFWATWCSACIRKFNMLDSLQYKYNSRLQVILINHLLTKDNKEKIERFFLRHKNSKGGRLSLPSVYNDTLASACFPHNALPHYVWIDQQQRLLAITGPDEVTAANIVAAVNRQPPAFAGLNLQEAFDYTKPLFIQGNAGNGEGLVFRSTLSAYIPGMLGGNKTVLTANNLVTQYKMINTPLLQLICRAYNYTDRTSRILFDVSGSIRTKLLPHSDEAKKANSYTYELLTPPATPAQLTEYIRQDMERYFSLAGKYIISQALVYKLTVDTACIAAYRTNTAKRSHHLNDADSSYIQNGSLQDITGFLNSRLSRYVIQQDSIAFNIDCSLPALHTTGETSYLKALAGLGIILTPATENVKQFLIYQLPKQQLP